MRSAPPVALVCDGGAVWRGLQALLLGLVLAVIVTWVAWHAGTGPAGMAVAALVAAAAAGTWAWRSHALHPQPQPLAWDGERWTAGAPAVAGHVEVMIDIGTWLLLRFTAVEAGLPARWLAVSAAATGGLLHPLRSALYGGAPQAAGAQSPERQPL